MDVEQLGSRRWVAVLLVLELLACWGAVAFAPEGSGIATWWPAAGIAVTLVSVAPRAWWPALVAAVAAVSAAGNVLAGRPVDLAVAFGLCNAAEALVAGWLLRRGRSRATLESQADVARLVLAALTAATVAGLGAAVALSTLADGDVLRTLSTVVPAHAASTMVLVPFVLTRASRTRSYRAQELFLQTVLLGLAFVLVFAPTQELALVSLPLPLLVWAAFRFGLRTVTWQVIGVAVLVTACTARGSGPFAVTTQGTVDAVVAGALTQAFLAALVLMCLPLAIAVQRSDRLTAQLRASSDLFRRNFSDSLVAVLVLRPGRDGLEVVDANEPTAALLGVGGDSLEGTLLSDLLVTDDPLEQVTGLADGSLGAWRGEATVPTRPGSRLAVGVARLSEPGESALYSAQLLDLTKEHEARAQLNAERQLSDMMLATTACMILVTDMAGTVLRVNRATSHLLRRPESDLLGHPLWEHATPPEHRELAASMFVRPDGSAIPRVSESAVYDAEGGEHQIAWTSGVVNDDSGRPTYLVFTGLDITAERNAAGLMQHLLQAALTTALIGIDTKGRITLFNTGAQGLLGRESFEMVGAPFVDLLLPTELARWALERDLEPTFETLACRLGDQPAQDWTWRGSGASETLVSMSLSRVHDHADTLIGYLCVATDVTETRATQEMLVNALDKERQVVDRLRELDSAKDDFVSTVSHELRTPVSSIVGYTELLQDGDFGEVPSEQAPVVDAINRNGARLVTLVDNLLALGSLTGDDLVWDRGKADLVEILRGCETALAPELRQRRLTGSFETPPDPVVVDGDAAQLARALGNILSNAVKFTEPRGSVTCRLERHDDSAIVVVTDTGLGIPREEQANLFRRFWRSTTSQTRHIQGTGLGLSIVQAIVQAHGGTVAIESEHLQGTTVRICLPLC